MVRIPILIAARMGLSDWMARAAAVYIGGAVVLAPRSSSLIFFLCRWIQMAGVSSVGAVGFLEANTRVAADRERRRDIHSLGTGNRVAVAPGHRGPSLSESGPPLTPTKTTAA